MTDLSVTVSDDNGTVMQTYGLEDFNVIFEGKGDIVVRTADGVLEMRLPGMFKEIIQGVIGAAQERQKNPTGTFQERMAAAVEKINGIR